MSPVPVGHLSNALLGAPCVRTDTRCGCWYPLGTQGVFVGICFGSGVYTSGLKPVMRGGSTLLAMQDADKRGAVTPHRSTP